MWKKGNKCSVVFTCLKYYENLSDIPKTIVDTVEYIINNRKERNMKRYYTSILKLEFHHISLWKSNTLWIINNWNRLERVNIFNVLISYRQFHKDEILQVCKEILTNWREELIMEFRKFNGTLYKINHLTISLSHPDLKPYSKQIASQIFKTFKEENNEINVPNIIVDIATQIVENDIYPEWEISDP